MKKLWGLVLGLALLAPFEARADWCYSYDTSPTYNGGGERIPQNCGLYGQTKVTLTDSSGNEVSVGGGTQYDEDTAHVSGDKVTLAGVVQKTADAALAADGDRTVLQVDSSGYLKVNVKAGSAGGVSVPEDQAHSNGENVVPIACRRIDTAATSATTSGDWATVDCDANGALRVRIDSSAIGSTSTDDDGTVTAGTASMSESLVRQYDFDGTDWVRQRKFTGIEDAAETAGGALAMVGAVQRNVAASSAGSTGDNATINVDTLGLLWTRQLDPCSGVAKVYYPVNIGSAATTEIVNGAGASNYFYLCSISLHTDAANDVVLVEDDTDACASPAAGIMGGTTTGTGFQFAASSGIAYGNGQGSIARSANTNYYVCLITSAATQLTGHIVYALAP